MKYAFILGRNAELSIAELGAFFGKNLKVPGNKMVALMDGELPCTPSAFLDRLGGCTEICEIFAENVGHDQIFDRIFDFLLAKFDGANGKCPFALNLIPENKKSQVLKFFLPKLKKALREKGIHANFMNNNFQNASPVLVAKNGMIQACSNINIIEIGEGKMALGFSVALQDFEAYSARDYGKPFRDAKVGMLPPKLAQVMVNIAVEDVIPAQAGIHKSTTIYDPFCGTGSIVMEALLMGYSAIGSDKDARLVEGARKNIDWLREKFPKRVRTNAKSQFFSKDATTHFAEQNALSSTQFAKQTAPSSSIPRSGTSLSAQQTSNEKTLAVVTEPFLGPPLSTFPHSVFLEKVIDELSALYLAFFENMKKWLPACSRIVIIFPYWRNPGRGRLRLSERLIEKIETLGYSKTAFDPLQTTSLFYDRPDQIVGREIVRFINK